MDNFFNIIKRWGTTIIVFSCVVSLASCSILYPRTIERWHTVHDTTTVTKKDSIFFRDSIYVKEWMKGDTVYIEKYKDRYVFRDRWRDSIQVREVHDTTQVEKKVEKELSWSQKTKLNLFPWILLALIGFAGWTFRKPIIELIKKLI